MCLAFSLILRTFLDQNSLERSGVWGCFALVVFQSLSTVSSFSLDLENPTWQTPPIVMVIGYSRVLAGLNRFPVTQCVTHTLLVTQGTRASAQVTSSICGAHRRGVLNFPPKVVGLVLLAGTRGHTIGTFRSEYEYDYEYEFSVLSTRPNDWRLLKSGQQIRLGFFRGAAVNRILNNGVWTVQLTLVLLL